MDLKSFIKQKKQIENINYILLDIDGVLNTCADWKKPFTLNSNNVKAFGEIFERYQPKIILTSTWRFGFISRDNPKNSEPIKKLEQALARYELCVNGVLNYKGNRGKAVNEFVKTHPNTIIIDDDPNELTDCEFPVIYTNNHYGFQKTDIKLRRDQIAGE